MPNSLTKDQALRTECQPRKSGGTRCVLVFKCSEDGCQTEVKIRRGELSRHSGKCSSHSHRKKPFESIYHRLFNDWRELEVTLTYEEFIEFTATKECHYCNDLINWTAYATVNGTFLTSAHFLDRKDCDKGYSKSNCVVCCTDCNLVRSNRFTYEEFMLLALVLQQIRLNRKTPSCLS